MEDQTSWRGHSFTLLVFTGIVVLCSIFFILGMLVGRAQGQKLAYSGSAGVASKVEARPGLNEEGKPDLTFYDSVKKSEAPFLEPPPPAQTEPVGSVTPKAAGPDRAPADIFNYQIGALQTAAFLHRLKLRKRGCAHSYSLRHPTMQIRSSESRSAHSPT